MEQLRIDRTSGRSARRSSRIAAPQDLPRVVDGAGHRVGKIGRLRLSRERPGLDARHVEQIGDEPVQPRGFGSILVEQVADVGRARNSLTATQDRGQRRAQIVADR